MFDNTKPNIILFADFTNETGLQKTIGPYKIAYELRKAGFEVAVIHHLHTFSFKELEHLLTNLLSDKTLFIGINSMFYRQPGGNWLFKEHGSFLPNGRSLNEPLKQLVKKLSPNCKFVLGGPDAKDVEYAKDYDYVIEGYADSSCINLANHLLSGEELLKARKSIFGFIFINDNKAENFDFPASTMRYESHDVILPGEVLMIEISRGCIFRCAFCSYPLNGKKKLDYIKYEELLYQEFLDNYNRFGTTTYMFSDDTFNDSKEKVEMIYRISKRLPFKLVYGAYARLDLLTAHPETIDLIVESGLRCVFFGIETFHPVAASAVGKGGNKEKQIETLRYLKSKYGSRIAISAGFIFGLPGEDIDSMKETAEFLMQPDCPIDFYNVHPMAITGYPGQFASEMEKYPEKYGYKVTGEILPGGLADWTNEHISFKEAQKMAFQASSRSNFGRSRASWPQLFTIIDLGFDIEDYICKPYNRISINRLKEQKKKKADLYKEVLYRELNITPYTEV